MAKLVSQTLTLRRTQLSLSQFRRFRSTLSGNGRLTEIELSPSSSEGGESEALMLKKLDDIVHRFIVQKATPDWLPFLPGYSFWVPPRRGSMKFADFVGKIADHLSDEESLSLFSDRGWPSSRFFVDGTCSVSLGFVLICVSVWMVQKWGKREKLFFRWITQFKELGCSVRMGKAATLLCVLCSVWLVRKFGIEKLGFG